MNRFNVFDRHLSIRQHYLLEASAGTGKTFSIQNIVTRLLVEEGELPPIDLSQILVVTFTRAATRDLKMRIKANIDQTLGYIEHWTHFHLIPPHCPDYLVALFEEDWKVDAAKKRLQDALFTFDEAKIFTIHGFCAKMLKQFAVESQMGLQAKGIKEPITKLDLEQMVRDFFLTEIDSSRYSIGQLESYLKGDPDQKKLINLLLSPRQFVDYPPFQALFNRFKIAHERLHSLYPIEEGYLIEDYQQLAPYFKNHKAGVTKNDSLLKVKSFSGVISRKNLSAADFDTLLDCGLEWIKSLNPSLIKKQVPNTLPLHYPGLTAYLTECFETIIDEASNFSIILARLASDCQNHVNRVKNEEEKFSPDDFLLKMDQALKNPLFLNQIQAQYRAAIIDEFQDTDPLQWSIFRQIFLNNQSEWKGNLYLVGDPKQSIYSFRQADIYTYLEAAQLIGNERKFSLVTNYRSNPALIASLNALFSSVMIPDFISLPKINGVLDYHPVEASYQFNQILEGDQRGALHFFIGDQGAEKRDLEQDYFLPYIAQEIIHLVHFHKLHLNQIAVLVRDRFQARELANVFDEVGIAYYSQKGANLLASPFYPLFIDLMAAVLNPRYLSGLKIALGGAIIGFDHEKLKNKTSFEYEIGLFQYLNSILHTSGFAQFFDTLLNQVKFNGVETVQQVILSRKGGLECLHDLEQLSDLIIENQFVEWNSFPEIITFLERLKDWEFNDDPRVSRRPDPAAEAVQIITLHYSKGLEFDVVFALGLINRKKIREDLYPIPNHPLKLFGALGENSEDYIKYCQECDAEKMRQLYVALTRAKIRLYIPAAFLPPTPQLKMGEASPMDLYCAKLNRSGERLDYESLYEKIRAPKNDLIAHLKELVRLNHCAITYSLGSKIEGLQKLDSLQTPPRLIAPPAIELNYPSLTITSFTGLTRQSEIDRLQERLEKIPPNDFSAVLQSSHTLPAGAETGVLLHSILEKIDYSIPLEQMAQQIRTSISHTPYNNWEKVIVEIIQRVVQTQISFKDQLSISGQQSSFSLAEVDRSLQFREMPFLFPYYPAFEIEEMHTQEGFIKGVIDLVFQYRGKYYIIDWKSNWLGPSNEDYGLSQLHQSMTEHHYFLQAKIYQEALKRFLVHVERKPFEECFGGIIYFYLRGLEQGKQTGIFFVKR